MENVGLVLEGGGMRGVYTCGVLEYFMEQDLYFDYIIGVSAGACNAVSYISKQRGRNEKVNIDYVRDQRYMSIRNLIREKSFFGMNFIFDEIPNKHVPFDFETFEKSACKFIIVATDCRTGNPVYLTKKDMTGKFEALRATASLPVISPIISFNGYELLDGGISDPIPVIKSINDGNVKNIIVLTKNKGYRKKPMKFGNIIKSKYKNYPQLIETLISRYIHYNETLDYIEKLEEEGKAIILRPSRDLNVGRLERNPQKLRELYKVGYEDTKAAYERIMDFTGITSHVKI